MSTLDEITKEKQRVSEALSRVDAHREKLTGELGELEAAERVLMCYSKGVTPRKTPSAKMATTSTTAALPDITVAAAPLHLYEELSTVEQVLRHENH